MTGDDAKTTRYANLRKFFFILIVLSEDITSLYTTNY